MIKCCIFDLDGTLTNTINTISYYGNYALEKNGLPAIDTEVYKVLVGNGAKILIERMLKHVNADIEEFFEKVFDDYNEAYDANVYYKTDVYAGVRETLDELIAMGVKIAVVSNKPDFATQEVLKHFFGENYFDIAFGQREGVAIKPDPVSVNEVTETLCVNKEECIYIGDTAVDMKTGKNAGIYTVGVLWGFRSRKELEDNNADIIIEKPEELLKLVIEK